MPGWNIFQWIGLLLLVILVGLPLYLAEKLGFEQDNIINWFERKLPS